MNSVIRTFGDSEAIIIPIEPVSRINYSLDELLGQCEPEDMILDEQDKLWLQD